MKFKLSNQEFIYECLETAVLGKIIFLQILICKYLQIYLFIIKYLFISYQILIFIVD